MSEGPSWGDERSRPWFGIATLACPVAAVGLFAVGVLGSPRLGGGDSRGWGAAFVLVGLMALALLCGSILSIVALMRSERPAWPSWSAFFLNLVPLFAGLSMTRL